MVWAALGYAWQGEGFICQLVDGRAFPKCSCVEDDSFMSYVVYMEREECEDVLKIPLGL